MFKRILVAVDGSAASNAGLRSAIQLAKDQRATLVALHVVDESAVAAGFDGGFVPDDYLRALKKTGRETLAKAEATARSSGVSLKPVMVESVGETIAHVILRHVKKEKVDVIVIGTHGRRGLRRLLMGSDAEAVVREAGVPVLLVRATERAKRSRKAARVVVGPKRVSVSRLSAPAS